MRRLVFALTLAALAAWVSAQDDQVAGSYRIGPRDQIQIHVEEMDQLNQEVTVAEDGTISLPEVGTLAAQGLTATQLSAELRNRLESRGMRRATVTISVTNYRSRPVSILGAVGKPGNHFVPRRSTLMEVLVEAGGVTADHGPEIVVRRQVDNGLSDEVRIAVADLIGAGTPRVNLPIFAGDLINVPPARSLTVLLIGAVSKAGSLTFPTGQRTTLLTAIARAGGLTENASRKIRIQRDSPSGDRHEIVADFRSILNNKEPDIPLEDGDLIIVKESFF